MAVKKTPTKKTTAKKPITTMAKASPIKQAKKPVATTGKPRVDDAEMKEWIKTQGAAKDKQVAAHKQGLKDRDYNETTGKGGYTNDQINLYDNIVKKGEWSFGGAKVNFKTGEVGITKFDKMHLHGSNKYQRGRVLTGDGKKEISKAGMEYGGSDGFASQEYLKPSQAARMSDKQFRKQFVKDSIGAQGRKEEMLNIGENFARVGKLYGTQTSEIGAKVKAAINNKKTSEKVDVKKKTPLKQASKSDPRKQFISDKVARQTKKEKLAGSPLKQASPTTKKKSVEINPKDGLRRPTPPKSRIGLEPASKPKGLPPGTKIDGDMSKSGRKYPSKDEVGTGRDSMRRQSMKDKLSSTKRTPVKMKKC